MAVLAAGGGIALDGGTLILSSSTILNNVIVAGGGGYGGHGERGFVRGGNAGNGGDGGDALGGGVYNSGDENSLYIVGTTIVDNSTNAAGGGFEGLAGVMDRDGDAAVEALYRRNRPYIGTNQAAFPATSNAVLMVGADLIDPALVSGDGDLGDSLSESPIPIAAGVGAFVVGGGIAATGAAVIWTVFFLGSGTILASSAIGTGAVGVVGLTLLPVLGVGTAFLTLAVIATTVIVGMAQGATFQESLNSAFPDVNNDYGVNFGVLIGATPDGGVFQYPPQGSGNAGQAGRRRHGRRTRSLRRIDSQSIVGCRERSSRPHIQQGREGTNDLPQSWYASNCSRGSP